MNSLEQYEKALANSKRNAMILTGAGAVYNANLISSLKNFKAFLLIKSRPGSC
jgi:hypothetical protein